MQHNIPEEQQSYLHCGRSLKSQNIQSASHITCAEIMAFSRENFTTP